MTELEQLCAFFERLGAAPVQAHMMATQLQKRADQLARERQVSRERAMAHLLEAVAKGRHGEPPWPASPDGKPGG